MRGAACRRRHTGLGHAVSKRVTRRLRAALRLIALGLCSLLVAGGVFLAALAVWLQTAAGRGWVERALIGHASEQLALTLSMGRMTGNLFRTIRLEHVALHDAQGGLVAQADAVSARYWLYRLILRRQVEEIVVERPVIVRLPSPPATRAGQSHETPADPSHETPAGPSHETPQLLVRKLTITDGSFRWHGHTVHRLSASSAFRRPAAHGLGVEAEVNLVLDEQPLFVHARAEFHGARAEVSAELHGRDFAARGRAVWADRRITARLDGLDVDAKLAAAAPLWAGRGALHAHGTLAGPLDALDLRLQGHTDNRGLAVGALVDVPHRTARLTAASAGPRRSAALWARAALRGGALDVTALEAHLGATRLAGTAHVTSGGIDATLDARVAPAEAVVFRIHPVAPIGLRVTLHGPAQALDMRIRGRLRLAHVALTGRVNLRTRRGQFQLAARDVRPSEIVSGEPAFAFSGAFAIEGAAREHGRIEGSVSVRDGTLAVAQLRFERVHGAARVRLDQPGVAEVQRLSAQLTGPHPRPIELEGVLRWNRRTLRFDASRLVIDGNHVVGGVVLTRDAVTHQPLVTIRAPRLSVSPALVEEALHRRPSRAWPGQATLLWTPNGFHFAFALQTDYGPASGMARLRLDRGALELPSLDVALGGSRLRGAARVKDGEVVASLDELLLQPQLVYAVWPPLKPALPLRIQGAAAGPLHALELRLLATSGPSTVMVRGRADLPARSFRLLAAFDNFQMARSKSSGRVTLEMSLLGRLVDGGVAGTLAVRHASGTLRGWPLYNGRLDATLDGPRFNVDQVLLGMPGAVVEGKGGGTWRDFRIGYGVVVNNANDLKQVPQSLRLTIGLTQVIPGRTVVGAVRRQDGGKIAITHRTIPPPFRWLNLLYHLLSGHPLHLTVQ